MIVHHRSGGLRLHHGEIFAAAERCAGGAVVGIAHVRVIPVGDDLLRRLLHGGVERGIDAVAACAQLPLHGGAVGGVVLQIALHAQHLRHHVVDGVFDVVGVVVHLVGGGGALFQHGQLLAHRLLVFLLGDVALLVHELKHVIGAVVGHFRRVAGIVVAAGVVARGVADHARQRGAFAQRKLFQILAEIVLRGDANAVARAAQIADVQILLENFLLGDGVLQLQSQIRLLHLALEVLVAGEQRQFDELTGDGRAALRVAAEEGGNERAANALDVDAVVFPEARVLDGHHRVDEVLRHFVQFHVDAVFRALVLGDQLPVFVVDERRLRLGVQHVQIEHGGGVHPRLAHADAQTQRCHADEQHHEKEHLHRGHRHGEDEVVLPVPGAKERVISHRFLPYMVAARAARTGQAHIYSYYSTEMRPAHCFFVLIS